MLVRQKIAAVTGILAPLIAFTCILTATASDPKFSWTSNALSDLGIIPGITGTLFNFGLITCGLLALAFALFGLLQYFQRSLVGKIGTAVFVAAIIALISIGVFNENFSPTHYLVSVTFFVTLPISLFIITSVFAIKHQNKLAWFTILMAIASAIPWILNFAINYAPNVAIPEFTSGIAGAIWIIAVSYKVLRQNQAQTQNK